MIVYHAWQEYGFIPPFKLVGFYAIPSSSIAEQNPHLYNKLLAEMPSGIGIGSCAVCGMSLVNNFIIADKKGTRFCVGCDCVRKHGDSKLITEVEAQKKATAKLARETKAKMVREAKYAAYQAELEAQRQRNGGLTDDEVEIEQRKEKSRKRISEINRIMYPVLKILWVKEKSSFCQNMANRIEGGFMKDVTENAANIIDDICKKANFNMALSLIEEARNVQ